MPCWTDMKSRVSENMPEPGRERQKKFDQGRKQYQRIESKELPVVFTTWLPSSLKLKFTSQL